MVQFNGQFVYLWNCGKLDKYGIGKCRSGLFSELGFEDFMNGPTRGPANDIPILSNLQSSAILCRLSGSIVKGSMYSNWIASSRIGGLKIGHLFFRALEIVPRLLRYIN
jgi:hypothetical protein